ncbi:hypothetical protein TNCV_2633351 [Trichonephila clavipes]|nr:hypothetical protein TNCV_2633351 [Trichonephila clavipes]
MTHPESYALQTTRYPRRKLLGQECFNVKVCNLSSTIVILKNLIHVLYSRSTRRIKVQILTKETTGDSNGFRARYSGQYVAKLNNIQQT